VKNLHKVIFIGYISAMKPKDLIKHFGGAASAAKAIGVQRRTVYYWIANKEIPFRQQRWIEFETGGALKAKK